MSDVNDLSHLDLTGYITTGKEITWGGFSSISYGILNTHGSEVALKSLRVKGHVDDPGAKERLRKRFHREAIVWSRFEHPNVVPLIGYMIEEYPIFVSPWYSNGNVGEYLKLNPGTYRRPLVLDVIDGLVYLHSIQVVHGDLKAENVLVAEDGHALLCDFGMSQFINEIDRTPGYTTTNANNGGTARFMCPELLRDEQKSTSTDIWALGCLIVQILRDEEPYAGISRTESVMFAIIEGRLPMTNSNGKIDSSLWSHIKRCWSKEQKDRPKASELRIRLTPPEDFTTLKHLSRSSTVHSLTLLFPRIQCSPDGRYLAAVDTVLHGSMAILEIQRDAPITQKNLAVIPKSSEDISIPIISWSATQRYLLVHRPESWDGLGSTLVFVVETGELLVEIKDSTWGAFLSGTDTVVFLKETGEIFIQDLTKTYHESLRMTPYNDSNRFHDLAISPDHQLVAFVTTTELNVYSLNADTDEVEFTTMLQDSIMTRSVSITHDGCILVCSSDIHPELWGMNPCEPGVAISKWTLLQRYESPINDDTQYHFTQFGGIKDQLIVTMSSYLDLLIWDRNTAETILVLSIIPPTPFEINEVAFSFAWNTIDMKDLKLAVTTGDKYSWQNILTTWLI